MWILDECTPGWFFFLCVWGCIHWVLFALLAIVIYVFWGIPCPRIQSCLTKGMTSPWFVVSRIFYVHPCGAWTNWLILSGIAWNQQWEDWRIQLWEASPLEVFFCLQKMVDHDHIKHHLTIWSWFQLGKNGAHIYDIHNLHNTHIGHHWHISWLSGERMTRHGAARNSSRLLVLLGAVLYPELGDNRGLGDYQNRWICVQFLKRRFWHFLACSSLPLLPLFASSLETGTLQHFWWFSMPFWRGFKIDPRVYWKSMWCFHCFHRFLDTNPEEFNIETMETLLRPREGRQGSELMWQWFLAGWNKSNSWKSNGVARWVFLDGYILTISFIHLYMVFHRMSQLEAVGVSDSP